MLEQLERANLFLTPLDNERRWWRFHQLFRDLLQTRLQQAKSSPVSDLHRRAAAWSERHALIDDALRHAVAADDSTWAVALVEKNVHETIGRGESVIVYRWLSTLPLDVVRSRPALSFAQAEMQFHLGDLDPAEHFLRQASHAVDEGNAQPEVTVPTHAGMVAEKPAVIALLRADVAEARADPEQMAEYAGTALAQLAENETGPRFWARWLTTGGADWMRGRVGDAEPVAAAMLAEGRASSDPYPLITSCYALAAVQQVRGELRAALRTYREGLSFATRQGQFSPFHAAEAHLGIAQVLYERDQLDEALEHVTEGIRLGRQLIWFFEPGRRLVTLAWIRQANGDAGGAMDAMNQAYRMHPSAEVNSRWNPAPLERARLLFVQGRTREVAQWIEERGLSDKDDVSYMREPDHLLLPRMLMSGTEPERALGLLQRLDDLAESQGRAESQIRIRALKALALQAVGDHQRALSVLGDALALARPQNYVRIFADEGAPMAALLKSFGRTCRQGPGALNAGPGLEHLNRVIRAFRRSPDRLERTPNGLIEPLTAGRLRFSDYCRREVQPGDRR